MRTLKLSLLLLACVGIVSCAAWRNGSPPTKTEQALYTVVTNYTTVVTTNAPTAPGQPETVTTNLVPQYTYSPGHVTKDIETGVSAIPVYGTLGSTAIAALVALWGWIRSSKNKDVGVTLAQSIETIREFVKALPNGGVYDNALVQFLQQHQAETGTIQGILSMLENDVSSPDAKVAAQQIIATIQALNPSALPPKPPGA